MVSSIRSINLLGAGYSDRKTTVAIFSSVTGSVSAQLFE